MTEKHKPKLKTKPDDPEQSKRFIDMAREVGADESKDALERAFEKVVRPKQVNPRPKADGES